MWDLKNSTRAARLESTENSNARKLTIWVSKDDGVFSDETFVPSQTLYGRWIFVSSAYILFAKMYFVIEFFIFWLNDRIIRLESWWGSNPRRGARKTLFFTTMVLVEDHLFLS